MTTSHPLADAYLHWLEPQIRDQQFTNRDKTYWNLLGLMFEKPFVWFVPNDDNRLVDGLDLRPEYCYAHHLDSDSLSDLGPCSFLEVLIGLSRRMSFATGGDAPGWAWQLIENIELHKMSDPLTPRKANKVDDVLEAVIWRTYAPDGQGGFFPLITAKEDQRKVELWYQMSAFIEEIHPEY